MNPEYYEVLVNYQGLRPGDVIWFTDSCRPDHSDLAAIAAGIFVKIEEPEWLN